ncbi:MAG: glycosyltransferase family 2 protein [Candidatus Sulfotelmatobacter sp.]
MIGQSVCAVVVTYNPRPTFVDNIEAIREQVGGVVVVDNGSSGETERQLQGLETRLGCKVIRNRQNLGIAVALNLGLKYAIKAGFDWVCTFDQDSAIGEGFISKMLEVYRQAPHPEMVALLAPSYVDRESGVNVRLKRAGNGEILTAMTSGSMMATSAIQKVGFFDETLYIDAVDIEFCLRARSKGMSILQSSAVLLHSLGQTAYYQIFGLRFGVTNHSAGRRYYMTRNRLRLLIHYAADWPWTWREGSTMLLDAAKIVFAEENKWKKFRAMAAGVTDALRGKVGRQIEL